MKKTVYLLPLFVLCFISACSKSPPPSEAGQETVSGTVEPGAPQGVILTEASLLELRGDGKVYWKANLNAGDTVDWKDEKQDLVRAYDGLVRTFFRVDMEGDYWVQDYAIAGPAKLAVTIADTVLYTKPDLTSPVKTGTVSMPPYTILALLPDDDPSDDFVKVSARLEGAANPSVSERYVKVQNISSDPNYAGAVKLARIASVTENPVVRVELLKNAMELAGTGRFLNQATASTENDPALFELELTGNLEVLDVPLNYFVTADTVDVRNLPSASGTIAASISQGETFLVVAKTKREQTLKAAEEEEPPKGFWYLANGNDWSGWIFGAYIASNPAY
ncbi:hypothetical protein AGMMS50230_12620 [Spirochaetia bacterium]|nr:hypothetical protein AGMMS50230_12620 [Spirochaetia bacterium]